MNRSKDNAKRVSSLRGETGRWHGETCSRQAVRSDDGGRRRRRWWIILLVFAAVYFLSWHFAWQIGLVAPCANMRYYYFSENDSVDKALCAAYWPMIRLNEVVETTRWGARFAIYHRERSFPTAKEMSRLGP